MAGLNRPMDRPFFVIGGAVKKTGGSHSLVKGQLALTDDTITSPEGVGIVASTAGKPKNRRDFRLRLGVNEKGVNRSLSNFSESTAPFSLSEVRELRVSYPERTELSVDEIIVGYDGFDPNTSFNFKRGDSYFRFTLELEGGAIEWRGGDSDKELVSINVEIPRCDVFDNCEECDECENVDCRAIVTEAIERLKRRQLTGGSTVADYVDITPVFSCGEEPELTPYQYFTLDVCDTGTDTALALVQAQFDAPVVRISRKDATSTYQVLVPGADGTPDDYEQTIASIIKGCEDCPPGFDPEVGGFVYAFTINDGGEDESAVFAGLANYVADSVVKSGNSAGVGFYTALYSEKLSSAAIGALITAEPTVTVNFIGEAADMCANDTVTEISWNAGAICNVTEESYSIVIPDTECGEDRLDELNAAFPNFTVTIAETDQSSQAITLTGTSGTANVAIDGTDYLAAFETDLTTTANNFVTAHAATILAEHGLTVTADAGVLTFVGATEGFLNPTITNATGNLDGTVADAEVILDRRACQTKYVTSVVSNIVCEECDPIFKDYYVTEAPDNFNNIAWTKLNPSTFTNGDCLCGIRIKGRPFYLNAEEALRDQINFKEDSVRVRASADYPEEIREGIGTLPKSTAAVKEISRFIPRTHLGGNLRDLENEGRAYFRDMHYRNDYLGRLLTGTTSNIEDQLKQYVHYTLVVSHENFEGSFARQSSKAINYDVFVEVGRHQDVEDLLNNIAANAGVETVQALA